MTKYTKFILLFFIMVLTAGCTSSGSINAPILPNGTISEANKDSATVKYYRSSDLLGIVQFKEYAVYIDYVAGNNDSSIYNTEQMMLTDRSKYMVKELIPGIHTFSFKGLAEQTVKLDKNNVYYLAVTFTIGGVAGLEFRTKEDFIENTKNSVEIRFKDSKCHFWSGDGCDYEEVK